MSKCNIELLESIDSMIAVERRMVWDGLQAVES